MSVKNDDTFDALAYLDELIEEMGLAQADAEAKARLKETMAENLHHDLFLAAAQNLEPDVIDMVAAELSSEKDPWFTIQQLVQTSPGAQVAMLEALDIFKQRTLEAYGQITQ
ncbi:MAG: hypothetical protein OEY44_02235 [Candidatus Peregrinibacteria bacterium]|nr:hypothetical protein [Candidatus Peregrinibacteria bacterium]